MQRIKDGRGRSWIITPGKRVRVEEDVQSVDGMLYKHSIVKLDEYNETTDKIRVTDRVGKVWWLKPSQISGSFL